MGTLLSRHHAALRVLLRELRVENGLTQTMLAERLGKPQSFVSKYESGERNLDLIEIYRICEACGIGFPEFAQRITAHLDGI